MEGGRIAFPYGNYALEAHQNGSCKRPGAAGDVPRRGLAGRSLRAFCLSSEKALRNREERCRLI